MKRTTCIAASAIAIAFAASASAQTVYSTGFEPPDFTTGSVIGQGGWLSGSGGLSQSVVDDFSRSGSQSLKWDNTGANQSFYSVRRVFDGQNGAISVATPLEISMWMYIDPNSTANRLYSLLAMNSSTSTMGGTNLGISVSGDGTVRAGTQWSHTYSGAGLFTDGSLVGNWIRVALRYDGLDAIAAVYDASNNEIWSAGVGTPTLANANGAGTWGVNIGTDYFTTTDRAGMAWFDDFSIRLIPAPGAAAVLGLAGLAAVRRRRA